MKKNNPVYKTIGILIILSVIMGSTLTINAKENIKTIAILPFKINAQEKLIHIQKGIGHMLYSRLSWKNNVVVVPEENLAVHLSRINNTNDAKKINEISRVTNSNFVLAGAITKLAGSFSIDVQVYDIEKKRYMAFFEQSQKSGDLINKTNRIAAAINKKIFNRTTLTWEKMNQEQKTDIQEQKRKNPEYMMKNSGWQDTEKSPGWKIWKYLF